MKITAVKTAATLGHGMHLWVRIETDEGITGLGECVHGGVQAIALIQELRTKLIGRDPFRIDALFEVEPGMNFDQIKRVIEDVLERGFSAFKIDLDVFAYGHHGSEVAGFTK